MVVPFLEVVLLSLQQVAKKKAVCPTQAVLGKVDRAAYPFVWCVRGIYSFVIPSMLLFLKFSCSMFGLLREVVFQTKLKMYGKKTVKILNYAHFINTSKKAGH